VFTNKSKKAYWYTNAHKNVNDIALTS